MDSKRRKFLKAATAAAGGAVLAPLLYGLLERVNPEQVFFGSPPVTSGASAKRYVWVIDLDRCTGCRKCTEGCQAEMRVAPAWRGQLEYDGKQAWIQVFDLGDDTFLPLPCQNCQNAPCVKVCPVGATYYSEDHIVLIDQDRCIGCRYCVVACPYERRFFNWFDPPVSPDEATITYSPNYNVPKRKGVAEKCIWCAHRVQNDTVPACVEACRKAGMSALWFGDAAEDVVSDGEHVTSLSSMIDRRGAYRLRDDLGTLPQVLYLPPRGESQQ